MIRSILSVPVRLVIGIFTWVTRRLRQVVFFVFGLLLVTGLILVVL